MYTPLTIANAVIELDRTRTPMGINKLVHFVHGWSLAFDRPLVGELPELWKFGPIYASLYEALRRFRNERVAFIQAAPECVSTPQVPKSDVDAWNIISQTVDRHRAQSDLHLSSIAHADRSPWKDEAEACGFKVKAGRVIPEWRIQRHYRGLIDAANATASIKAA